jgi:glycosyltransferase involved in cell wall biosynthesis
MPNVVLEASSAAVPVVATAVGGTPEVVADGRTGFLVPANDPDELAARIVDVLKDEPRRRQMGEAGRQFVRQYFTFDAQAASYMKLFEQLQVRERAAKAAA